MVVRRSEMWLWRVVGIFALGVCSLNVMVLWKGPLTESINRGPITSNTNQQNTIDDSLRKHDSKPLDSSKEKKTTDAQPLLPKQVARGAKAVPSKDEVSQSVKTLPFLSADIGNMLNREGIVVLGNQRKTKAYLTIGVPTVKRNRAFYLPDTLRGLVNGLKEEEISEVTIVVFIADFNDDYTNHVKITLEKLFPAEVASGLIQVIVPPKAFYPEFRNLPLLFHDSIARVQWRSKQALDYSFLYYFSANLGEYFMQLEDDVQTENNYLSEIKKFINSKKKPWSTLEFGARGFIGMMYKSDNLLHLAKYCRVNFFLMPVDWLFRVFNDIWLHGNDKDSVRKPPLFKHVGTYSSLEGQVRKLEDIHAKKNSPAKLNIAKLFKDAHNPPAQVSTSIVDNSVGYPIKDAYGSGQFWGKTIKVGDSVTIVFQNPVSLKRVVFASGSSEHLLDSFEDTEVFVSNGTQANCDTLVSIKKSNNAAIVDVKDIEVKTPVKCVKLQLNSVRKDEYQINRWLIISEIAIWVNK